MGILSSLLELVVLTPIKVTEKVVEVPIKAIEKVEEKIEDSINGN